RRFLKAPIVRCFSSATKIFRASRSPSTADEFLPQPGRRGRYRAEPIQTCPGPVQIAASHIVLGGAWHLGSAADDANAPCIRGPRRTTVASVHCPPNSPDLPLKTARDWQNIRRLVARCAESSQSACEGSSAALPPPKSR